MTSGPDTWKGFFVSLLLVAGVIVSIITLTILISEMFYTG